MVRISGISQAGFGSGGNLYTKRERLDNSELYINNKLSALYQRTIANSLAMQKLDSIREFTYEGKKIDRIV